MEKERTRQRKQKKASRAQTASQKKRPTTSQGPGPLYNLNHRNLYKSSKNQRGSSRHGQRSTLQDSTFFKAGGLDKKLPNTIVLARNCDKKNDKDEQNKNKPKPTNDHENEEPEPLLLDQEESESEPNIDNLSPYSIGDSNSDKKNKGNVDIDTLSTKSLPR